MSQGLIYSNLATFKNNSKFFQLFFKDIQSYKALCFISSIKRINAVSSDNTSLNLNLAHKILHFLTIAAKNTCFLNKWLDNLMKWFGKSMFLLSYFHIIMNVLHPQIFRKFSIKNIINNIFVLIWNSAFSSILFFC